MVKDGAENSREDVPLSCREGGRDGGCEGCREDARRDGRLEAGAGEGAAWGGEVGPGAGSGAGAGGLAGAAAGAFAGAFAGAGGGAFPVAGAGSLAGACVVGSRGRKTLVSTSSPRTLFTVSLPNLVIIIPSKIHTIAAVRHRDCRTQDHIREAKAGLFCSLTATCLPYPTPSDPALPLCLLSWLLRRILLFPEKRVLEKVGFAASNDLA